MFGDFNSVTKDLSDFMEVHLIKVISERFQSHFSEYALMILK